MAEFRRARLGAEDRSSKGIAEVKVGDRVANSQPGRAGLEEHRVDRVIVTQTDHDFVDLKVKPGRLGKVLARTAVAAGVLAGGAVPATAADAGSLTTTYHHPFYDVTRGAFVEAVDLRIGDELQTADGGMAEVAAVTPYHSTEVTYDLTINDLYTTTFSLVRRRSSSTTAIPMCGSRAEQARTTLLKGNSQHMLGSRLASRSQRAGITMWLGRTGHFERCTTTPCGN